MHKTARGWRTFGSVAIGLTLSVFSIMLTSYDPLWSWLGVARDLRSAQTTSLAILFVSLGTLLALYNQQKGFHDSILSLHQESFKTLTQSIPQIDIFSRYSGDEAMRIIATQLLTSKCALNTRIFAGNLNPTRNLGFREWDIAVRAAVRRGLTYRDVVSLGNEDLVKDRCRSVKGGAGDYDAVVLKHDLPTFLNFIVLESDIRAKEVWFGWLVSRGSGFADTTVIRTSEAKLISAFEQWHRELFAAGRSISI